MNLSQKNLIFTISSLGLPLIVGQLGVILQSFADTMMVGQYGTLELSASGFVANVFNLVIFFLLGISYGTTPVVGALFGRKDYDGVARCLRESLLVNVLFATVLSLLMGVLFLNLSRLGQPVELLPLIRPYFLCQLVSLPFLAVFNSLKQFSDALGRTRTPMWIMLASNFLNILLNFFLIFGVWGFPELGLLGAGVATLVVRIFMPVAMSVLLLGSSFKIYVRPSSDGIRLRPTRLGLIHLTVVGLPVATQMCLEASSFNIAALFMGWLGTVPLAAHQVMGTISTLCFLILYGVGGAVAILVSQFRGQGNWEMVRQTVRTAYVMSLCLAVFMTGAIVLGFRPLASLFTTSDEVIGVLLSMLLCFVVYQFGDCTQILFANVLRGMEQVRHIIHYAFIAYILVSLPLSYFFAFILGWGSAGVWWGMPFGLSTAAILFWNEYRRKCPKNIEG